MDIIKTINLNIILQKIVDWALTSGIHIIIIVLLTWISLKLTRKITKYFLNLIHQKNDIELQKRMQTLGNLLRYIIIVAILSAASMMILREFGINIAPLLAATGIAGLAVGFGAQSLVKDVI